MDSAIGARARHANLRLLVYLRASMIAVQTASVLATHFLFQFPLPLAPLLGGIAALGVAAAATCMRLRHAPPVSESELLAQCLVDVTALTFLLYFTGGAINPFAFGYLLLIVFAVRALPRLYAWLLTAVCVATYTLLQFYNIPLHQQDTLMVDRGLNYAAHWVIYALLAVLVPLFGIRLGEIQLEHQRRDQLAADKDARERYLLGLAALAAGTAHEMGTPLSTMSVVLGDLRQGDKPPEDWKTCVEVLWLQVQACRRSLSDLVNAADPRQLGQPRGMRARELLESLVDRIRLLRPEIALQVDNACLDEDPEVDVDVTLQQALLSLLNNAVDASPQAVELRAAQRDDHLRIEILDRGPGMPREMRERPGRRAVTTKRPERGRGIGVLVANSAVERFGGTVKVMEREGGGTAVHVDIPVSTPRSKAGPGPFRKSIAA